MTAITPLQSSEPAVKTAAPSSAAKANMDYDSFLKLFMAQMKNQDPTKPNDPTATLSQLASFSNVEQSIKTNGKLDQLLSASNMTLASALIGKTVSTLDGTESGVAKSIETGEKGLVATLADGRTLDLAAGYKVSAA
jgi:flagellar basal-body rod modification protein FlgD